jgi:hypothetical protein
VQLYLNCVCFDSEFLMWGDESTDIVDSECESIMLLSSSSNAEKLM